MAALDFPDNPSTGTVYDKWTWNGTMWVFTNGIGAGYTFVQEFTPIPTKVGDTWFDTSTGATGGTSWVAIEEGAVGSEKVWVQTSPGQAQPPVGWVSYAPTWSAGGSAPALGNSTVNASYMVRDGLCTVQIDIVFGATGLNGGTGPLALGLPIVPSASIPAQWSFTCYASIPSDGSSWVGVAYCPASNQNVLPHFPASRTLTAVARWQACDQATGANGTGVPLIPGQFSIQVGGRISIFGSYRI